MKKLLTLFTRKNIINAIFVVLMITLLVSTQAKVPLIRGMVELGLMRPPTKSEAIASSGPSVNIVLHEQNGALLQTSQLRGKVLLINVWATWCPPCVAEMPSLNKMYLHYKNNTNVVVLPVDADNNFSKSVSFMYKNGYSLPVYKLAASLPEGLMSNTIPTTLIIDKNGRVVARHEGAANYASEAFYKYIDDLLQQ